MKQYVLTIIVIFFSSLSLLGQQNILKDFGSSRKNSEWNLWAAKELRNAPAFQALFKSGKLIMQIPDISNSRVWFAQVRQRIELTAGKQYRLQVKVKADKAGIMALRYELDSPPWSSLGLNKSIKVSPGEKIYSADFTVNKNNTGKPVAIKLCFGKLPGNITVSEVKLKVLD